MAHFIPLPSSDTPTCQRALTGCDRISKRLHQPLFISTPVSTWDPALITRPTIESHTLQKITTLRAFRTQTANWRNGEARIALVPTMGALHDGHLSLVKLAKKQADRVVVSVFVNPTQFAKGEDLSRYPRDEASDLKKLRALDVDVVWAPSVKVMYGATFATSIVPSGAALELEGAFRPKHFAGVATVCCKLFNQVIPDIAIFGEKDYQQLSVIKQLVRDLNMPVKIVAGKTLRANDGLALSSRNRYLSAKQRDIAPALAATLKATAISAKQGERISSLETKTARRLTKAGFATVDYVAVRDAETLGPYKMGTTRRGRVLAAAWLGKTRLIDNCAI